MIADWWKMTKFYKSGIKVRHIMRGKFNKKVFVAMSGGVDSSVTALFLKNTYVDSRGRFRIAAGQRPEARYSHAYDVTGVFMRCYNVDGCAEQDATDARRVAEHLGMPFYVFDFEEEYKRKVVEYMIEGYRAGITPNPDVECNREIKFGLFLKSALELGADYVATGHYARKRAVKSQKSKVESYSLFAGRDPQKDQSYFLWTLTQDQLKYCLFPIGDYSKSEVREMAREAGLPTADKKDSQGICFLGRVRLEDFLKEYIPEKRGEVLTTSGAKIGEHEGAHFYTIGQRHLGANSKVRIANGGSETKPHYIAEKNIKENTIKIAPENDPALFREEIELNGVNFIDPQYHSLIRANRRIDVMARVRYRQPLFRAELGKSEILNPKSEKYTLIFDAPQKFVAPGQSAVFYEAKSNSSFRSGRSSDDLRMLGGGVII